MIEMSSVNRKSVFSMGDRSKKQDGWSGVIRETKRRKEGRRKNLRGAKKKTKVGK